MGSIISGSNQNQENNNPCIIGNRIVQRERERLDRDKNDLLKDVELKIKNYKYESAYCYGSIECFECLKKELPHFIKDHNGINRELTINIVPNNYNPFLRLEYVVVGNKNKE